MGAARICLEHDGAGVRPSRGGACSASHRSKPAIGRRGEAMHDAVSRQRAPILVGDDLVVAESAGIRGSSFGGCSGGNAHGLEFAGLLLEPARANTTHALRRGRAERSAPSGRPG